MLKHFLLILPTIILYLIFNHYYDIYHDPNTNIISPIQYWQEKYKEWTKVDTPVSYKYDCDAESFCKEDKLVCYGTIKCNKIKQKPTIL